MRKMETVKQENNNFHIDAESLAPILKSLDLRLAQLEREREYSYLIARNGGYCRTKKR